MESLAVASSQLVAEVQAARTQSDRLFSILRPDVLYQRPIAERHRVIFYVGHLEAFDYIQICREGLGMRPLDADLDSLFQAGIDPDSNHLPSDTADDWPSIERINQYVAQARKAVDAALEEAPAESIAMALEHRLMHLETLAYMFHNFDHAGKVRPVESAYSIPTISGESHDSASQWCDVAAGDAVLGRSGNDGSFGWDNEFQQVVCPVPAFRVQKFKVTNGDYLKFVEQGANLPHFWLRKDDAFFWRGMFEDIPLPLNWPVYVTQKEAAEYAGFIGKELMSEAQFHRAAYTGMGNNPNQFPWGDAEPTHELGNFDFKRWEPESIYASPGSASKCGAQQLVGNGWEWTRSLFEPFPGFQARDTYPGYSASFFDGEHYVIKGGSPRTAARLLRSSFRNWFRPDYPYVYSGFRCVENK